MLAAPVLGAWLWGFGVAANPELLWRVGVKPSASSSSCCWLLLGEKSVKKMYKSTKIPGLGQTGLFWHIKVIFYIFK